MRQGGRQASRRSDWPQARPNRPSGTPEPGEGGRPQRNLELGPKEKVSVVCVGRLGGGEWAFISVHQQGLRLSQMNGAKICMYT